MTGIERQVLLLVWVHGKNSVAELSRFGKLDRELTYATIYRLRRKGLVEKLSRRCYDVTDKGREVAGYESGKPLLKGVC